MTDAFVLGGVRTPVGRYGNTHATVVMIGEKAADLVRAPAARPPARDTAVSAS